MKLYTKVLLAFVCSCFILQIHKACADEIEITNGNSSNYVISLAEDAIPAEKIAASQLQKYLQLTTGISLKIQSESTLTNDTPQILIGAGKRVKSLLPNEDWNALGTEGIVIKTVDKNLILAGGRPRGTLYAVFQFLEDQVGVRWWTPMEEYVPRLSSLKISPLNIDYVPPFIYREHFATGIIQEPLFATRMKSNGQFEKQDETWGGHFAILGWVHTFDKLLPPQKYFYAHPEWYSDPQNGNKPCTKNSKMPAPQTSQLNLGNEEMRAELTKNALEWIRQNPQAGIISISQNDNNNWCHSEYEEDMLKKEGSPSGALLKFVNEVAQDIHKEFPGFLVETLAYQYTRHPPLHERPGRNVVIRLSSIDTDFSRPLDSEANKSFRDDLLQWRKIAPRLYIWNYAGDFNDWVFPAPNLFPLGADLRFFAQNNVIGVFEQGDGYSNGVGDFIQLRTWLTAKLLWNPFQDEDKLIDEFLQGYYGAAAPDLKSYLDLMHNAYLKTGLKLGISPTNNSFLTLDVMNQATALFDSAQRAVKNNPELSLRVKRARLSLDHAWILRYNTLHQLSVAEQKYFSGPENISAFVGQFIATAQGFGIANIEEHKSFEDYIPTLQARFAKPAPLPDELKNKVPPHEYFQNVLDVQDINLDLILNGGQVSVVDDPQASDKKAARIIGTTKDWVVKYRLQDIPSSFLKDDLWQCYAVIRIEKNPESTLSGNAFNCGIYDYTNRKTIITMTPSVAGFADGEYHLVDLGAHTLTPGIYIWVTSVNNPAVSAVYVDRIILIRNN